MLSTLNDDKMIEAVRMSSRVSGISANNSVYCGKHKNNPSISIPKITTLHPTVVVKITIVAAQITIFAGEVSIFVTAKHPSVLKPSRDVASCSKQPKMNMVSSPQTHRSPFHIPKR